MMSSLMALLRMARSKSAVAPRLVGGGTKGGCGGVEGRQKLSGVVCGRVEDLRI